MSERRIQGYYLGVEDEGRECSAYHMFQMLYADNLLLSSDILTFVFQMLEGMSSFSFQTERKKMDPCRITDDDRPESNVDPSSIRRSLSCVRISAMRLRNDFVDRQCLLTSSLRRGG